MSVDVAFVGAPFLDLAFEGLPRVPAPGEELVARGLLTGPGGTGAQAVAAARLGLSVALVAPRSGDLAGRLLADLLAAEGVVWSGGAASRSNVTALLSTPDGTAMASTVDPGEPTAAEVAAVDPAAVVVSIGRLALAPPGCPVHAVTGPLEVERAAGVLGRGGAPAVRSLVCNAGEAATITGIEDPAAAAAELGRWAGTAVVTLGAEGAVASESGRLARASAPAFDVADATGAGDLFVAAYVWADARGLSLEDRLLWSTLYAALSVRTPSAADGAADLATLLAEGARRGMPTPPMP